MPMHCRLDSLFPTRLPFGARVDEQVDGCRYEKSLQGLLVVGVGAAGTALDMHMHVGASGAISVRGQRSQISPAKACPPTTAIVGRGNATSLASKGL